jgi:transglutaminase-like putative cysteine protease
MIFSLRLMAMFSASLLLCLGASKAAAIPVHGGDGEQQYDIRNIPAGLRSDASAVIRDIEITFDVSDRESASKTVKQVITIFTPQGREFGVLPLSYDRFRKIKDLDGALLDERGKELRSLGSDDIKDQSDIEGFELYDDARVKRAHLYHDTYPYTVVFTYRIAYKGYVSWPTWRAQSSSEPVEHNRFTVIVPDKQPLRYWLNSDSAKPVISVPEEGRKSYVWEARDLPELSEEQLGEDIEKRTTVVHTAPGEFKIEEYAGDMTSWEGFGKWAGAMYAGKDALPEAAAKEVRAATATVHDVRGKIDVLYRYMQSRSRYVAVELGIGGWEPFNAGFVHEKGYGDCKALSNYMVAILKEAGITAYPALVCAGGNRSDVVEEFPSDKFNHVIVCVPGKKDSVWLECTSRTDPPGHLGTFTENRPALLLTPAGGVLVHTPSTTARQNKCSWSGRVELNPGGAASASLLTVRTGDQSDNARYEMLYSSPREQEDWLLGEVEVVGTVLRSHSVEGLKSLSDTINIAMHVDMPNLGSRTSGRLFFQPNLTNRRFAPPRDVAARKSPARLHYPYIDTDSLLYILPTGYVRESLPPPVVLSTSFAKYRTATIALGDTAILYSRTLEMNEALIPAPEYNKLADFYRGIARADKAQVVLVVKQ